MSSRSRMLKRGRCSLINEYSSISAATSLSVTIHSRLSADCTIATVRVARSREKYCAVRLRSDFAFPTYRTACAASRKRYTPGESGTEALGGRVNMALRLGRVRTESLRATYVSFERFGLLIVVFVVFFVPQFQTLLHQGMYRMMQAVDALSGGVW